MAIKNTLDQNENIQPNTELLQTLQKFLPQYFDKDGNFKADKFEAELKNNNVSEARDGYRLGFVGKDYARLQTGQASETVIVPDVAHNTLPENINSQNVFITGDNLEALRHLQNAYAGKIKMIYIDPPYNTGKEFVYNDKFDFSDEKLKTALGYTDTEIERLKSIQGKSSHSAWLTFMYPRLKIAQKLLTDDGVIFVSIDDNEQANLKLLMDDIFGEGNFVGQWNWYKSETPPNLSLKIKKNIEYILGYEKSKNSERFNGLKKDSKSDDPFTKPQNTIKELLFPSGSINIKSKKDKIEKGIYGTDKYPNELLNDILVENGKNKNEVSFKNRFIWTQEKLNEEIKNGTVINLSENGVLSYKKANYNPEVPPNFISSEVGSTNEKAGVELIELMKGDYFDYPKPIDLIKYIINFRTKDNDIILDFFAGSSTTAHAVMQLNSEDQGNRKYIMVQWDEPTNENSEAYKAGYKTIDEISRERIKRAANKIKASLNPSEGGTSQAESNFENNFKTPSPLGRVGVGLDLGFKHYRLQNPDIKTLDKIVEFNPNESKLFEDDMISPFAFGNESGLPTILQTWLIQDGYDFNTKTVSLSFGEGRKGEDYEAIYVKESATLYLINTNFSHNALKDLLNKIGKNELTVNTIIVYPYSFSFEQMRELKNNLKTNVEAQITIIERY